MGNDYPEPFGLTHGEMALELAENHFYSLRIQEVMDMCRDPDGMSLQEAHDQVFAQIVEDYQNLGIDRIIQLYTAFNRGYA